MFASSDPGPDLDDPRYSDAESAIGAWREVVGSHRRHVVAVALLGFVIAVLVVGVVL